MYRATGFAQEMPEMKDAVQAQEIPGIIGRVQATMVYIIKHKA